MAETADCPTCGAANDAAQRFCGHCGAALSHRCAACGEENPPGFRFCGACGAPCDTGDTSPSGSAERVDGERRWVTVMFADLSGFTALSERTDPEEIRSMVDRCMSEMGEVVERFGGSVDKVIGDALMAVFGAPVAHEDDPSGRCAPRSRSSGARLSRPRLRRAQRKHRGQYGRGDLRSGGTSGRRELTVMGDAVNTAARLQAGAAPGRRC